MSTALRPEEMGARSRTLLKMFTCSQKKKTGLNRFGTVSEKTAYEVTLLGNSELADKTSNV